MKDASKTIVSRHVVLGNIVNITIIYASVNVWGLCGDRSQCLFLYYTVIVVFCGRNGKFAAAKFAPFRNLLQILLLFMKNLSFHHFKTEVVFFKVSKFRKSASHNSFKAPSLFKTVILKAVQSVFKLLLLPAVTFHLNRVLSSFSFTRLTICAVIYAACFVFVFAAGVLFPCTWFLTRYGQIPWFRSERGKICSPCYYTPTTFIIQLLDPLQSSQFSLH